MASELLMLAKQVALRDGIYAPSVDRGENESCYSQYLYRIQLSKKRRKKGQ